MSLDSIIDLNISIKDAAVSRAGFGTPLILTGPAFAHSVPFQGKVRSYSSLAAIADDGFESDSQAYLAAQAIFSQSPRPSIVKIGVCANAISLDAAATEVESIDPDWYALILGPSAPSTDSLLPLAAWTEARRKLLIVTSDELAVPADVDDDVASQLRDAGYHRTALIYHHGGTYADAAWAGVMLPKAPGSASWKFKTLAGIAPMPLTDAQRGRLDAKHCNHYTRVAGVSIMREGYASSGRYLDITRGIDWLHARMQEELFSVFANAEKIPYTDGGIAIIENTIRGVLSMAVDAELIDEPSIAVNVPRATDVSPIDRASRVLPDVSFSARLAGAVHKVQINGTVTV